MAEVSKKVVGLRCEDTLNYWGGFKMTTDLNGSLAVLLRSLPHYVGRRKYRTHRARGRVGVGVVSRSWMRRNRGPDGLSRPRGIFDETHSNLGPCWVWVWYLYRV